MKSFVDLKRTFDGQPADIGVLLQRIDVGRGREELYGDQAPQLLKALADQSRIESIRASSAIEGVDVPDNRAAKLANAPELRYRKRNEKEFAGYRDAIDYVVRLETWDYPSVGLALHLHRLLYRHADGRGGYLKDEDNEISDRDEHGRRFTVFHPVDYQQTPFFIEELMVRYQEASENRVAHPLVLVAAFIVDLLAIHPVIDGNGRVARLLTAHELLRLDYGVIRYVSIEQRIYETKNAYYTALEASQRDWHAGEHSIWPWTRYLLEVLTEAYNDFEARVAAAGSGMSKQDRVRHHVLNVGPQRFTFREATAALPGISAPTIRNALTALRTEGLLRSEGRGAGAIWIRTGAPDAASD
jgi:Fic family protein